MSKKRTPVRSGTASPAMFGNPSFGAQATGGFASSTTSVLSLIGEPPDLTQILDSSVVVLFKNLSKKEEVTRAKALEGLLAAVEAVESVEEAVLTAWVRLYPGLSIDVSARVRRLANSLQGAVGAKSGKRLARHMPKTVGPWLCGLFDSDRASTRATQESLLRVFKTEDRLKTIWKAYQSAILDFCKVTVATESVYTLSDERWVVPDDAEAKFARVMATCCLGVAHLVVNMSDEELKPLDEIYRGVVGEKTLWTFAFHTDPFLRRSMYRLLQTILEKRPEWISSNLEMIATALIMKASANPQIGSVNAYLETLEALTSRFPEAWRLAKPSKKKTPLVQFVSFVERGSQTAPPIFWSQLSGVFAAVPEEVLTEKEESVKGVLTGILNGIRAGPEPKSHMVGAWGCYWDVCYRILGLQPSRPGLDEFILQESILPIYKGCVVGGEPEGQHTISHDDSIAAAVCGSGLVKLDRSREDITTKFLSEVWKKVEDSAADTVMAERAGTVANATAVKRCGEMWVRLTVGVLKQLPKNGLVYKAILKSNVSILSELIESLLSTNGKAVGAAVFVEQLLAKIGAELLQDTHALEIASDFFLCKLPGLLEPGTVEYLLGAFVSYGAHTNDFTALQEAWKKTIHALMMSALPKEKKEGSIILLLNSASSSLAGKVSPVPELDSYIMNKMRAALPDQATGNGWILVKDALKMSGSVVSQDTTSKMLVELLADLSLDATPEPPRLPRVLDAIAGTHPHKLIPFISSDHGRELISKLLVLANSPDDNVSSSAGRLRDVVKAAASSTSGEHVERLVEVTTDNICVSVCEPTSKHLSIDYLTAKASALVKEAPRESAPALLEKLLFSEEQWESAINPFLQEIKSVSLAISNPLTGCIFLVDSDPSSDLSTTWDAEGYSAALRMTMFSLKLIEALGDTAIILTSKTKATLLRYILLVQEIVKDNLTVAGANDIWQDEFGEAETETLELTSTIHKWAVSTLYSDVDRHEFSPLVFDTLLDRCGGASVAAFYTARALSVLVADLCQNDQFFRDKALSWTDENDIWKSNDTFRCAGMLVGADTVIKHARKERLWMGLIGSLLGVSSSKAASGGLQQLVLLNTAFPSADEGIASIPQPRAIKLIKHLLSWLHEDNEEIDLTPGLIVEVTKTLCNIFPIVKSIYGEHWESTFDFIKLCWEICLPLEEEHLPMVSSTLKLFQVLKTLLGENDDLDDSWEENRAELYSRLVNLLQNSGRPDAMHQPRNIVNMQIARQLRDIDVSLVEDLGALYPLLGTQARPIQKVAFDILHRYIPTIQEQISVNAALSSDAANDVQLPPEILSMIIEAPGSLDEIDIELASEMPIAIRGYLLSWILIFDHFLNASFKVKSIYVDILKEGQYMPPLLNFISTTLFSQGRSFDASKVSIQSYTPDITENPLHDLRWLQTHLYYFCLLHTPSLVKSWWLDTGRNRATTLAVEAFTGKYMSPLLIENELLAVTEWVQTRDEGDEDGMVVKVAKAVREVTASYPVDDQAMDILIRLPVIFPLRQVEVTGLRRVGLDEKRFKQMQLASQAVVNFQSGSIIDALTLFCKNVSLHFQGISECAICYSILAVTPDRSLPNRACSTCKNKFHSTCLLKWFKTSNSSSCPLCRTSFSFYS